MYEFILNQLIMANIKKDIEQMKMASDLVLELRNLWMEVIEENIKLKGKAV